MEIVLYLAAGSVTGVISGRQMRLREKYRELSEKLQKSYTRLHEETEQLIEAEEQLAEAQKFSALGKLSAYLAHEIKNPLSSIKGTAEILLDDFPEGHPKREFVDILLKETARLNHTVEDVLQFSRGKKGKAAQTEPLSDVIKRVSTLLDRHLRGKEISLQLTGLDQARNFLIDGSRISQVFLNILLNAIDAVAQQGKIRIEVMKTVGGYTVDVSDNGPGIPETEREKIFEPFVSGKEGGTGLGLVITRKIVTSYGGTIALEASDLGGASFRIFLPERVVKNNFQF
jgi:signal transduction histidine kinase